MFLTIGEMRQQIKSTKVQLLNSARIWVNTLNNLNDDFAAGDWLIALHASNSGEMEQKLREHAVPVVKNAEFVCFSYNPEEPLVDIPSSSESPHLTEINVPKYFYNSTAVDATGLVEKAATLTTLMEHLHQLDDLLSPFEPSVGFGDLKLCHEMTKSILNEWRFVNEGQDTVDYYTGRLQTTKMGFDQAMHSQTQAFEDFEQQFNIRLVQFYMTLCFLSQCLTDSFFLHPDERFVFLRWFSSYLPWQTLINNLSLSVFGNDAVSYPNIDSLDIKSERLMQMSLLWSREFKQPILRLKEQFTEITAETQRKIDIIEKNLKAMSSIIGAQQEMGARRYAALSLLPTQVLPLHGFFQNLQAIYGQPRVQQLMLDDCEHSSRIIDADEYKPNL